MSGICSTTSLPSGSGVHCKLAKVMSVTLALPAGLCGGIAYIEATTNNLQILAHAMSIQATLLFLVRAYT